MQYVTITEGKAKLSMPKAGKLTKKTKVMPVFYNPVMKFNRDISILLLNSLDKKDMQIALPLAGSGVRGIRFLLELKKNKIKSIYFNDINLKGLKITEKCIKLNKIRWDPMRINLGTKDANVFMVDSKGFDYIDIDPFGSPNPFLDTAIRRLARGGILAVTATDTAALCGTSPKACARKYFAKPLRNELMHEIGLRILIRKVQLEAAQYDKALTPIFSYSKDHYMRVFFLAKKSKQEVDKILKQHKYFLFCKDCLTFSVEEDNCAKCNCHCGKCDHAGPLFAGELWDSKLIVTMLKDAKEKDVKDYLTKIKEEMKYKMVGFYDIPGICKKHKIRQIPKRELLLRKLDAAETVFSKYGLRTKKGVNDILNVLNA